MDSDTGAQLGIISEIAAALREAGIRWWLYGGWAMDFRAGRVTRDHSDIELFIWRDDVPAVQVALASRGFFEPPGGLYPEEARPFLKDGQEIGAWFLVRDERGRIVTPGRWSDWPWLDGAFDAPNANIGNVEAPAISIAALLDMKENFATHKHGQPLRPKDAADIELLRRMLRD